MNKGSRRPGGAGSGPPASDKASKKGRTRAVAQARLGNVDLGALVSKELKATPLRNTPKALQPFVPVVAAPDPAALTDVILPPSPRAPADDVVAANALSLLRRTLGKERRHGDVVEATDRVRVSCLAFSGGGPVPFTARAHVDVTAEDDKIPGAHAAAVGKTVGTSVVVPMTLPAELPDQPAAGRTVNLVVEIVAAFAASDVPLTDEAVRGSELAPNTAALLKRVKRDLIAAAHVEARGAVRAAVLRKARERYPVDVNDEAIDALVHLTWAQHEGPVVERMKVPADEQRVLLDAWKSSADLRQDARVRLWNMALVHAFGESRGVELSGVDAGKVALQEVPGVVEVPASKLSEAFAKGTREGAHEALWYLEATDALVDEVIEAARRG